MSDDEGEQQVRVDPNPSELILQKQQIADGLSIIEKISDGSSYAYTNLSLEGLNLGYLGEELKGYQHVRHVNLSKNSLTDVSELQYIPYILEVNAHLNLINTVGFLWENQECLKFMHTLNLNHNKLTELQPIHLPSLQKLNVNENEIETCVNFKGHEGLTLLELRKNKLTICKGLNTMPNLIELYLAENEITSLDGLKDLDCLERLHLRKNKIEKLEVVPYLPKLKYLNLRDNLIASKDELLKLHSFVTLQQLNMQGNPFSEEKGDDFKKEVLIALDQIKWVKINKEEVTAEEVEEAAKEKKERIEAEIEAEKERLRAEEEARLAAQENQDEAE